MITEIRQNVELLHQIKEALDIDKFDSTELENLVDELESSDDFTVELDGCEYRFISEDDIENTFDESVREMIESCYGVDKLPPIIACHLDWEGIVRDCMVDGHGHHFASYDGCEHEVDGWYIFRTN